MELGDPVTYQGDLLVCHNDIAISRGFDNKMGAFVVAEAMRLLVEKGALDKQVGVYAVGTVQEEVGYRGASTAAFGINAATGVAVDVSHATDYPSAQKFGRLELGKGPTITRGANINPVVFRMLREAAAGAQIPLQVEVEGESTGTDASAMQVSREGMATGLIGVPLRYMHSPCEMLNLRDVEQCAELLAAYCRLVRPDTDFTPRVV